ncbi:unnamed protein product, partial [Phaeothamnion confervicola]
VRFPLAFNWEGMRCRIPNGEVTPDKRYVLVHAFLSSEKPVEAVAWQNLVSIVNKQGEVRGPTPDCGVDSGNGLVITMGQFPLKAGREVQMLLIFTIHEDELPVRLELGDGTRTVLVER